MTNEQYVQELNMWRASMNEGLTKENGWLALSGLFWLHDGENKVGTAVSNHVTLPSNSAPAEVGTFTLHDGQVTLAVTAVDQVQVDGKPSNEVILQPDTTDAPSFVTINNLRMVVIQRGEQFGIRLWDNDRPERQTFNGRKWHPPQEKFRVTATYVPFDTPETITFSRSLGADFESEIQGYVNFSIDGIDYQLHTFAQPDGELFTLFKDGSSGKTTYGAGRYLLTEKVINNQVIIDFNRVFNPPCAYTSYATCTLPPRQNWLPIAIDAGELSPK